VIMDLEASHAIRQAEAEDVPIGVDTGATGSQLAGVTRWGRARKPKTPSSRLG
jgi:hypothetical protein